MDSGNLKGKKEAESKVVLVSRRTREPGGHCSSKASGLEPRAQCGLSHRVSLTFHFLLHREEDGDDRPCLSRINRRRSLEDCAFEVYRADKPRYLNEHRVQFQLCRGGTGPEDTVQPPPPPGLSCKPGEEAVPWQGFVNMEPGPRCGLCVLIKVGTL